MAGERGKYTAERGSKMPGVTKHSMWYRDWSLSPVIDSSYVKGELSADFKITFWALTRSQLHSIFLQRIMSNKRSMTFQRVSAQTANAA